MFKKKMHEYYYLRVEPFNYKYEQKFFDFTDFILNLEFPGFHEVFKFISLLNHKLKKEEPTFNLSQKKKFDFLKK